MPVKRRASKRRVDPMAEAWAWATAFHCKHDFFGDLAEFGLTEDKAILAAMPDAWRRLGGLFISHNLGDGFGGEAWALREFGEPPCR
jgi:hypothetical protein